DETAALFDHPPRRQTTRDVMRADAGRKHGVPAPARLPPEGKRPRELAVFDHALVTAPDVVHEQIEPALFSGDTVEHGFDLTVIRMVARDSKARGAEIRLLDRSAGHIDRRFGLGERLGNALPDTAASTGHKRDLSSQNRE